ncbi:Uncharacterised protein [Candidatus Bilamarchaeum dharawalense]|uniref:Uncharacterized protein n=1 Tax=Candidatus Bilamarchaeum dharawalense TaxID=2885759 RepID=A0A5E4LPX8_9ARCH|nr:Uncharacterised protein [Candidatus Bilamarchaeum dharawalense]
MKLILVLFVIFVWLSLSYAEVPEHEPSWDSNCGEGFQWSRGTASCKQADCPSGAGRTYTYECNCGEAWDKPFRTCYDPKRPGYVIACVAAGAKCPGEEINTPPSAESCDYDSDCPTGYVCNPTTNRCEQLGPSGCTSDYNCQSGYRCKLSSHQCEKIPEDQTCNEVSCALSGGTCENGKCIDKCKDVTCNPKCDGGEFRTSGSCRSGNCIYGVNVPCKAGCSKFPSRCKIIVGKLNFLDIDNTLKPIKNAKIETTWYDLSMAVKASLPTRYSKEDGTIEYTENELEMFQNGTLEVKVIFEDQFDRIQVVDGSGLTNTSTDAQRTAAPVAHATYRLDLNMPTSHTDLNLTLTRTNPNAVYAKIYFYSLQAADFMKNDLKLVMKHPPERVYANDQSANGAFHNGGCANGIADRGVSIDPVASSFDDPAAPTNREWHEFGHHIMYEVYGYHLCGRTKNHGGYWNPDSVDSYTEGFAEFMSMMMLDYHNYPKKNLYFVGATPYDMEVNYKVNSRVGRMELEETALASIYYDLLDGGPNDDDGIQLSREQIWNLISTKHNLDGNMKYIESIWDAYRVLNASNLPGLHDDFLSGYLNPAFHVSKLDRIFITHGVYADRNYNSIWEPGEDVGFTIFAGRARADAPENEQYNKPVVDGSYIKINAKNEVTGDLVDHYPIHVVETITGTEEGIPVSYSLEFDTVPDEKGEININMPPEDYNTTMKFSFGGDDNFEKTDGFELTSTEFFQKLNPDVHTFNSYTVQLKPKIKIGEISCCTSGFVVLLLGGALIIKN